MEALPGPLIEEDYSRADEAYSPSQALIRPILTPAAMAGEDYDLGLDGMDLGIGRELVLVADEDVDILQWSGAVSRGAPAFGLSGMNGAPPQGLATVVRWGGPEDGVPDVLLLRFEEREWKELDTWEKIGLVTQQTAAVAGIAVLLMELFN